MKREEVLDAAKNCVCGKREQDYGSPEDNFSTIANLWSTYLDCAIRPVDVAVMMAIMKIARIKAGGTDDCFVDLAGYAACAGEVFEKISRTPEAPEYISKFAEQLEEIEA